jgi:hypothetical protein
MAAHVGTIGAEGVDILDQPVKLSTLATSTIGAYWRSS